MIARFDRCVAILSRVCGVCAAGMIVLSVAVICHAVGARYLFGASSYWQTEFVTNLLIAATFIGSPYVMLTKGHVKVGLLSGVLSPRGRRWLGIVSHVLTLAICAVLAATAIILFAEAFEGGWKSASMWAVRLWIPYSTMALGLTVLTLQVAAATLNACRREDAERG